MKKKYYFIIGYIIFVILLGASIYRMWNVPRVGEAYLYLYKPLEHQISIIEKNMNEITNNKGSNKWVKLKDLKLEDEKLKNTYNLLVEDIKICYLLVTDLKNEEYGNIKVIKLKNEIKVNEKQLSELTKRKNCLKNFEKYNTLALSDDPRLSNKIRNQISIIIDYNPNPSNHQTLEDIIYEELVTVSKIASLSTWLKIEYYTRKNLF